MKPIHWIVVLVLFWAAWIVFRLGTALDIQPGSELWWWLGLPIGFAMPAAVGYNLAKWRFYHKTHSICTEGR